MFLSPIFAEEEEENGRAREERRKPKEKEKGLKRLGLAWSERVASSFWKAKKSLCWHTFQRLQRARACVALSPMFGSYVGSELEGALVWSQKH